MVLRLHGDSRIIGDRNHEIVARGIFDDGIRFDPQLETTDAGWRDLHGENAGSRCSFGDRTNSNGSGAFVVKISRRDTCIVYVFIECDGVSDQGIHSDRATALVIDDASHCRWSHVATASVSQTGNINRARAIIDEGWSAGPTNS